MKSVRVLRAGSPAKRPSKHWQSQFRSYGRIADLSSSNNTMIAGAADFESAQFAGRNIWFGVREFAMAAAMNGIQLHGGTKVYGGTFFVFLDYLKAAVRLSAIKKPRLPM